MKRILIILGISIFGCNSNDEEAAKIEAPAQEEKIISEKKEFQNGDIIFHTSLSNQSLAIQIGTNSKYSHMGIIYQKGEKFYVYEAVQPVKLTPIKEWINRGENGHYVVRRLKASEEILTPDGISKMKKIGKKYLGKSYDSKFEWSDDKIYCSELVWKIYKEAFNIEIGELQKIKDFDLSDKLVQAKLKERYGKKIPMEELVITPDGMFKAKELITIIER